MYRVWGKKAIHMIFLLEAPSGTHHSGGLDAYRMIILNQILDTLSCGAGFNLSA
jgi:hypothetical protein